MAFTVKNLIDGNVKPIYVKKEDKVELALSRMFEYEFSQLPVVDEDEKPVGIISSDSILRALVNLRVTHSDLIVSDAMLRKPKEFRESDDLFDLLDELEGDSTIFVIDTEGKLIGIVTSYDTTQYLRRRAQDVMFVEDIENTIKDYIKLSFTDEKGQLDEQKRTEAIVEITPSNKDLKSSVLKAFNKYFEQAGGANTKPDIQLVEKLFDEYIGKKPEPKSFDLLTLYEYIEIFLHPNRWSFFKPTFRMAPGSFRKLLESVLKTRNDLSHFRTDLTLQQRDELLFCKEWLIRNQPALPQNISVLADNSDKEIAKAPEIVVLPEGLDISAEESAGKSENRFAPLGRHLSNLAPETEIVELPFTEIEEIIGGDLPPSARKHRAMWANDPISKPHSKEWLDAGWRVETVYMTRGIVVFKRWIQQQMAYIEFFSSLLADLSKRITIPAGATRPNGYRWLNLAKLPQNSKNQYVYLSSSFTRDKHFRVELYIQNMDKETNKKLFNALQNHKIEIESELGETLSWQRLDNNQGSRIAVYTDGDIDDSPETLATLRNWAVERLLKFYDVMNKWVTLALKEIENPTISTIEN